MITVFSLTLEKGWTKRNHALRFRLLNNSSFLGKVKCVSFLGENINTCFPCTCTMSKKVVRVSNRVNEYPFRALCIKPWLRFRHSTCTTQHNYMKIKYYNTYDTLLHVYMIQYCINQDKTFYHHTLWCHIMHYRFI